MQRIEALNIIQKSTRNNPVVVTCAATSRELAHVHDGHNHLYLLDSMGLVGSVMTGLAMSQKGKRHKIVGIEGDGSLLMNPNVLFTNAYLQPKNTLLILLDNKVYGSTANIPTYGDSIDFATVAASLSYEVRTATDAQGLQSGLDELLSIDRPGFLYAEISAGNAPDIPKLLVDPVSIKDRFVAWLDEN